MIQVDVHDFNTHLVQKKKKKKLSLSVLCDCGTHISSGCVLLKNQQVPSISHAWPGSGCGSLALRWPPTPAGGPEQLTHICRGVPSAWNTSLQLVPSVFVWVSVRGHGRPGENSGRCCCWRGTVWSCMLPGVWHCCVEVQCHTTSEARNKTRHRQTDRQTDTNAFRFSNTINRVRL